MTDNPELSPTDWVREQTQRILEQGTTDGVEVLDRPVVLFTTTGAKSGKKRYVPLMRVEDERQVRHGRLQGRRPRAPVVVPQRQGQPAASPCRTATRSSTLTAREIDGAEREHWWKLAVEAYPPYAEYQTKTDRQIPVFVLE